MPPCFLFTQEKHVVGRELQYEKDLILRSGLSTERVVSVVFASDFLVVRIHGS